MGRANPDKGKAKIRFALDNVGRTPVRIISTIPGCGCMTPSFDPAPTPPGGRTYLDAEASYFPVGERRVPIVVDTDSTTVPRFELSILLIGGGTPPFLLKADGNLSYLGGFDPHETQDLLVHAIEPEGRSKTPTFQGVPNFLQIEPGEVTQVPYVLPGTFNRSYKFRVRFTSPPPENPCQGEFFVVDPWNPARKDPVKFLATFTPPVRSVPALVLLRATPSDGAPTRRFSIVSKTPLEDTRANAEGGGGSIVRISPDRIGGPSKAARFEVSLDPSYSLPTEKAEFQVVVTWSGGGRLSVPVVVIR